MTGTDSRERDWYTPLIVTLVYLTLATAGLYVSDVLFVQTIADPVLLSTVQTAKAGAEVVLTAGFIYVLTTRSRQSLERTNRRLHESNRVLGILQRVLRHNLRNKLNVVRGRTSMLVTDTDAVDETAAVIYDTTDEIIADAERTRLIRSLIQDDLPRTPLDVTRLVDERVERFHARNPTASVTQTTPDSLTAVGNTAVGPAVTELLENAVEHNPSSSPHVDVDVDDGHEAVEVTVADDGPGIPSDEVEAIDIETTADQLTHSRGLGLWVAFAATYHAGGSLRIDGGRADDTGTEVTIRLPKDDANGFHWRALFPSL